MNFYNTYISNQPQIIKELYLKVEELDTTGKYTQNQIEYIWVLEKIARKNFHFTIASQLDQILLKYYLPKTGGL